SEFPLAALQERLAYLARLGISTIYASPILASRQGSSHGYDGIDPSVVDPELGGQEGWEAMQPELKQQGLNWLQDIVPNHLAYSSENAWLKDIFLFGPQSQYYQYFDVDWAHPNPELRGRLMLPVLGQSLEEVIEAGQITLSWEGDHFTLAYFEHRYPMALASYPFVLAHSEAFLWLSKTESNLHAAIAEKSTSLLQAYQQRIHTQYQTDASFAAYLTAQVERINHNPLDLKQLLDLQCFAFEYWPLTDTIINYRRFFTVNDLICLNMQREEVFDQYHQWIKEEASRGHLQGLRIDHIDGLQAPGPYLDRLVEKLGNSVGIWVEKILEQQEELPAEWPIQGSTGYEFLSRINKLLTYGPGISAIEQLYQSLLGEAQDLDDIIYRNKRLMLHRHLVGEWDNLFRLLNQQNLSPAEIQQAWGDESIRRLIGEFLLAMPVYRIYAQRFPLTGADRDVIQAALKAVAERKPQLAKQTEWFQQRWIENRFDNPEQKEVGLRFLQRLVQFSGPLMAKGLEDTTFYTYLRFLPHNEVGEDPHSFSLGKTQFRAFMQRRAKQGLPMNTLSTHDTKRGEDARARLLVLSEMPQAWANKVHAWEAIRGQRGLSANDAYLVYQTLLGAWPMDGHPDPSFESRIHAYLEKALREAKTHTQWGSPNSAYESLAKQLASDFMDPEGPYRAAFDDIFATLRDHGIINSLSQVLLKNTCPGLPDLYQGCESWNLSLVDPDNRRPVDYEALEKQLARIAKWTQEKNPFKKLWKHRQAGPIKLWLTQASLLARQRFPELFSEGEYLPLEVQGKYAKHVMAYARRRGRQFAVILLPLYPLTLSHGKAKHLLNLNWGDTQVLLPPLAPHDWQDQLGGRSLSTWKHLPVSEVFTQGPWALLTGERPAKPRQAGVLMHISSLPTAYGIGDLGPTAHHFVDWLYEAGQQLWQVLPLNSTQGATDYSPYASDSAMAGNGLFISPEQLETEGLLTLEDLSGHWLKGDGPVDFAEVESRKQMLIDLAFQRFLAQGETEKFEAFCEEQAYWLADFALYRVIKGQQQGK
ncbi:MAG: malto-oligosyltrehalose synthase, partial [Bacteroidota bacterium]